MLKLFLKSMLLFTMLLILLNLCSAVILKSMFLCKYFNVYKTQQNVFSAIDKSNSVIKSDVIVLGDSVATQLYGDQKWSLCSNAKVTMAGQYILLCNFMKNNCPKRVYLLYIPWALPELPLKKRTYNSFIKPFYTKNNLPYITAKLNDMIKSHRYYFTYTMPMAKVLPLFELIDCSDSKTASRYDDYCVSKEYIKLIKELCDRNNVSFRIISPPISQATNNNFNYKKLREFIDSNNFNDSFENYIDSLLILNDSYFRDSIDTWHYKNDNIRYIKKIFEAKTKNYFCLPSP